MGCVLGTPDAEGVCVYLLPVDPAVLPLVAWVKR